MRKMPQIPRDVFFGEPAAAEAPVEAPAPASTPVRVPVPEPVAPPPPTPVTPPVAVEVDKIQVTVYLSPLIAKRLEALRFHLLNEHNVRVSKSALAEYAIAHVGDDLAALAQDLTMGER